MEESKRQKLQERMNFLFCNEEEKLKEKKRREEQLKRKEQTRKRRIKVKNVFDLTEKYEDYDIKVDSYNKMVTLKKPLEVKHLGLFRYECNSLGFGCGIENRSIDDLYRKHSL